MSTYHKQSDTLYCAPMEQFAYDPVGNRLGGTYDAGNRLLEDADYYYSYDKNGNTTQKLSKSTGELTKLYYDAENQLIKLEKYHAMSDTVPYSSVSYIYDGLGRRVAKNIDSAITKYVYDQEDILLETDVSDSIIARYTHGPGIDEPVIMDRGGSSYYYIADALGSIAKVLDKPGNVINRYVYNSFGNIVERVEGVANPYTYTGREYDAESGLYYYRARYYDARIGRFINEDPLNLSTVLIIRQYPQNASIANSIYRLGLRNPTLLNPYTYVDNKPIRYIDPFGLWYIDLNVSLGLWLGGTWGAMLGPEGIYPYGGGGLVSPWGGFAVTWSPNDPTPSWNVGGQIGWWIGTQQGCTFGEQEGWFHEYGFVTPGVSFTVYKVGEPWKWPWKQDEDDRER